MRKRPSILLIEPRQNIRTTLEMTLCHGGMQVFSAVNLDSALLQLRVLQPDLIIIGFERPGSEEGAAVARIKALSSAPLLALGDGNGASPVPGVADTLSSPLNIGQLCVRVAGLLDARVETHL